MPRFLDALASRIGTIIAIATLILMCGTVVLFLRESSEKVRSTDTLREMTQVRNAFVAINDLMRLKSVLTEIHLAAEFGPREEAMIVAALDKLFVRAEDLQLKRVDAVAFAMTRDAVAALMSVVDVGDKALEQGVTDVAAFSGLLRAEVERARKEIFIQPQKMAELQRSLVDRQAQILQRFAGFSIAGIIIFTLLSISGLLLLQREVVARKQREKAENRSWYLAYFDTLTGLPNRVRFRDEVEVIMDSGEGGSIAYIDLDRFKSINDTYGHAMGDAVLRHLAARLRSVVEGFGGIPARLSGDEFAAFLPTQDTKVLTDFGQLLLAAVSESVSHKGNVVSPSLSVGLAGSTSTEPTFDAVLRAADFALFVSKEDGRGRFTLYDKELENRFHQRREIMDDLPRAIADGELDVYFQPKVTLPSGTVYGFEALVRWTRDGEFVPVEMLIRLAEQAGLVTDIDLYVMKRAVELISDFNQSHGTGYSVSVNLSALNFIDSRIVAEVDSVLRASSLRADLLTLEITESEQLGNWDSVRIVMTGLHALGCKISIDDFGTGYSSLAYLRSMPADEVKIDRSLVQDIDQNTQAHFVLDAIIDLAGGLNMSVVVEGIERSEQAQVAHSMGCQNAQGYLFGKPVPARDALACATNRSASDSRALISVRRI